MVGSEAKLHWMKGKRAVVQEVYDLFSYTLLCYFRHYREDADRPIVTRFENWRDQILGNCPCDIERLTILVMGLSDG